VRPASMVNYSSSGLNCRSRVSPSTWSSDAGHQVKDGTFLRNHAPDIAAMDLFVVPTIGFKLLYGFVIIRLDRRDIVWINVTTNPTAEWVARQITEAFPWDEAPGYMIRDRDRIYGTVVTLRRPSQCLVGREGASAAFRRGDRIITWGTRAKACASDSSGQRRRRSAELLISFRAALLTSSASLPPT
jgi:hypothetical protein